MNGAKDWIERFTPYMFGLNVLLFVVLLVSGLGSTNDQVDTNSAKISDIVELRKEGRKRFAAVDVRQCQENNAQNQILADLLRISVREQDPGEPPPSEREKRLLAEFLLRLAPSDCSKLH